MMTTQNMVDSLDCLYFYFTAENAMKTNTRQQVFQSFIQYEIFRCQ